MGVYVSHKNTYTHPYKNIFEQTMINSATNWLLLLFLNCGEVDGIRKENGEEGKDKLLNSKEQPINRFSDSISKQSKRGCYTSV